MEGEHQVIHVEVAKMNQEWLKLVGQMSFVKHVDVKGNHIKIEVEDTRKN